MAKNVELVQKGINILHPRLAEFVCETISYIYKGEWWNEVRDTLKDKGADLPREGKHEDLIASLDFANCIRLIDWRWNDIFSKQLSLNCRNWAKELMGLRNTVAHAGSKDFAADDVWRALDTMQRLAENLNCGDAAESLQAMKADVQRHGGAAAPVEGAPARFASGVITVAGHLPSWREVMEPHADVAQGRYKTAEFAANLAQAAKGEGPPEYSDPKEFFARTYITHGIKELLVQALRRVSGANGEPVIQLKTAFGGGKTHSMLALFHLLSGKAAASELSGVDVVLKEAGVAPPAKVHTAVLVGTALNPTKSRKPPELPGVTVNTLWGELAAQLAISAGRPELYELVSEADAKSVPPGNEALRRLIDECGPCLILMDELLAYAKKLYNAKSLPAGTYDNFITFMQELTEAAATSKRGLIAASLPESEIEIGGEAGKRALEAMEHTFSRTSSVWNPVQADEGFEVVRRRLFSECKNPAKREEVCSAFSRMYRGYPDDFPLFAREGEYKDKLISCYPIHPEVFDHLYGEWSTLENFQRTRGVLRLMAAVIHELWMQRDAAPMIMPGSIPLNVPDVKNELMRYVPEEWNAIVDKEIDGESSAPYNMDKSSSRFGDLMAARRLSRAIMLGSAPAKGKQAVRGIEAERVRLSVVQPDESIAVFNDALNALKAKLAYLYTTPSGDRFWYDTRPTLRKIAEERAAEYDDEDIEQEVRKRILALTKGEKLFAGVHVCPSSPSDVPDEQTARLVVLAPKCTFKLNQPEEASPAITACKEILDTKHGANPRSFKNMLVFLAPDPDAVKALKDELRSLKAWQSILDDSEALNLGKSQEKEAKESISRCEGTAGRYLSLAYCWIIFPYTDLDKDRNVIVWQSENMREEPNPVVAAGRRLAAKDFLISQMVPSMLLEELNRELQAATDEAEAKTLWDGDSIEINKLWSYFCTYCYLPRLFDYSVLEKCIKEGIAKGDFGYAEAISEGRFLGLKYKAHLDEINYSNILVKKEAALRQLEAERKAAEGATASGSGSSGIETTGTAGVPYGGGQGASAGEGVDTPPKPSHPPVPPVPANTSFHLSKDLDYVHVFADVKKLVDEVISHLANEGAKLAITLNVEADIPKGTPPDVARTVKENCRTLEVDDFGFNG